jgi:hypothetical protein
MGEVVKVWRGNFKISTPLLYQNEWIVRTEAPSERLEADSPFGLGDKHNFIWRVGLYAKNKS